MVSNLHRIIQLADEISNANIVDLSAMSIPLRSLSTMSTNSIPLLDADSTTSSDYSTSCMSSTDFNDERVSIGVKPRTIFSSYWSKYNSRCKSDDQVEGIRKRSSTPEKAISCSIDHDVAKESSFDGIDGTPSKGQVLLSPRSRRQIFGTGCLCQTESSPALLVSSLEKRTGEEHRRIRYVRSASSITDTKHQNAKSASTSCLRRSRFSFTEARTHERRSSNTATNDSSLVSFSPTVDVMLYQTPKELWSADDWHKYYE